jgi:hypothetical protein
MGSASVLMGLMSLTAQRTRAVCRGTGGVGIRSASPRICTVMVLTTVWTTLMRPVVRYYGNNESMYVILWNGSYYGNKSKYFGLCTVVCNHNIRPSIV